MRNSRPSRSSGPRPPWSLNRRSIRSRLTLLLAALTYCSHGTLRDHAVRLAVLDVRTFGHPSRSSRPCRSLIPPRSPHVLTFEDFPHSVISCLDAIVLRHLAATHGPPAFAEQSSCIGQIFVTCAYDLVLLFMCPCTPSVAVSSVVKALFFLFRFSLDVLRFIRLP